MNTCSTRPKIGLALGAGGARGFCHIGVIEVLQENDIPIDIITGCSMGALLGGGLAAGVTCEQMRQAAEKVNSVNLIDFSLTTKDKGGIIPGMRVMKIVNQLVGKDKKIEDCQIPFAAIATDIYSGTLHTFTSGTLWDAIRASIAIPGIFQPVTLGNKLLTDGGVLRRMPIQEARDLGADIVIAVDPIGPPYPLKSKSTVAILEKSAELIAWQAFKHEGKAADVLITPILGTKSQLLFRKNLNAIQAGRTAATAMLPEIRKAVYNNSQGENK